MRLGKTLRRAGRWFYLLEKRLFKRPFFLLLLAAVPLLVVALTLVSGQDSGILRIALYQEDSQDPVSASVVAKLTEGDSIIQFVLYDSAEAAAQSVSDGISDGAWIFSGNLTEKLGLFLKGANATAVRIVEREDTVFLQLAREKLFSALYSPLSYQIYREFIQDQLNASVSEEELEAYYTSSEAQDSIIEFSFMNQDETVATAAEQNYLTAPIRGLLSLMILLVGLASAMYFTLDETQGSFVWLSARTRQPFAYLYHMIAIVDVAAVVYLSLYLAGVFTLWQRELPLMLLYCVASAGFCELVRRLLPRAETLGIATPLLLLLMLVLCPVFLNVRRLRPLQYLLPPFYYLHGVHNQDYVYGLAVYTCGVYLLSFLVERGKSLFRRRA
jgi:hypothetical protein